MSAISAKAYSRKIQGREDAATSKRRWRDYIPLWIGLILVAGIALIPVLKVPDRLLQVSMPVAGAITDPAATIVLSEEANWSESGPNEDAFLGDRLAPGIQALVGGLALLVSVWAVWLVRGTLTEARKATAAANKAADAAVKANEGFEKSSKAELRAYVGPEGVVEVEVRPDASARVKIQMRNFGDTPAFKVRTRFTVGWRLLPLNEAAFETDTLPAPSAVESETSLFPTAAQGVDVQTNGGVADGHAMYQQGHVALVVFGRICYQDIFGEQHTTGVRMFRTFDMPPSIMRHHSGGNEAD